MDYLEKELELGVVLEGIEGVGGRVHEAIDCLGWIGI